QFNLLLLSFHTSLFFAKRRAGQNRPGVLCFRLSIHMQGRPPDPDGGALYVASQKKIQNFCRQRTKKMVKSDTYRRAPGFSNRTPTNAAAFAW
ncbi:MAG: hypothetical protein LUB58_02530, partial [Oscillospiraceae bacterium]|nr:hypothetical protein [Oscillospiraceae bacterium]